MKISKKKSDIYLSDIENFNIEDILECGQCFRFHKLGDKKYVIIAHKRELTITQTDEFIIFHDTAKKDFENIWFDYFDLNTDYKKISSILSENDSVLKEAINFAKGTRILRQEPFECLISFIISQNNRIPMIKTVVNNISEKFGEKIENYYTFPSIEELKNATVEELNECKTGFRSGYIRDAVSKISAGELSLCDIEKLSYADLKTELMKIKGVGEKVSDCVALFAYAKLDAFPIDVWVKRITEHFYFDGKDTAKDKIEVFAKEKFGEYSGYAQQYLFHYARMKQIGK